MPAARMTWSREAFRATVKLARSGSLRGVCGGFAEDDRPVLAGSGLEASG
jgi:hypothetical protein